MDGETVKVDSWAGKEFSFSRVENELLEERVARAEKLAARSRRVQAKAQRLERQSVEARSFAVTSSYEHACERLEIPEDRAVAWIFKGGVPVGFKILPLEAPADPPARTPADAPPGEPAPAPPKP